MNNYYEYVTLPNYIIEKQKNGNISLTHFSDILRFTLLYKYGGIWFDATIFQSGDLYGCIKDYDFFTLRGYNDKPYWTSFFVASAKGNIVSKFMMEFYYIYWKNENALIEYLLIDDLLQIGYEEIPTIKSCIDKIPKILQDEEIYKLYYIWFMEKWDKDVFKKLCNEAPIHKLSWKFSKKKKII